MTTLPPLPTIPHYLPAELAESLAVAALQRAHLLHDQNLPSLPCLRVVARCASILVRAARQEPEWRTKAQHLLRHLVTSAYAADRAAQERGETSCGYLSLLASCAAGLQRIREWERRAAQHSTALQHSEPSPAPMTRQPVGGTTASPHPPERHLTQRARWLAEQDGKKRKPG